MGMFDYITLECPWCKKEVEEQTKAGPCLLKNYRPGDSAYMDSVMVGKYDCPHCGNKFEMQMISRPVIAARKVHDDDAMGARD